MRFDQSWTCGPCCFEHWEALNALGIRGRHLDYGTYDGEALLQFKKTRLITTGVGLDLNKKVIEENVFGSNSAIGF